MAGNRKVRIVTARGAHVEAEVTKEHRDGNLVDVKFQHNGEDVVITKSPKDETGKQPDSWHEIPAPAETDESIVANGGAVGSGAGASQPPKK